MKRLAVLMAVAAIALSPMTIAFAGDRGSGSSPAGGGSDPSGSGTGKGAATDSKAAGQGTTPGHKKPDLSLPKGIEGGRFDHKDYSRDKSVLEKARDAYDRSPMKGWFSDGTIGVQVEVKFKKEAPTSRAKPTSLPPGTVWVPDNEQK